jgi:hypothetical protein
MGTAFVLPTVFNASIVSNQMRMAKFVIALQEARGKSRGMNFLFWCVVADDLEAQIFCS